MTISTAIAATNLSKNGAGNLTLGGAVTLAAGAGNGTVAVNAGTLTVGAGASFTNATTFQVSRSAALDVTTSGLTLGTGQTVTGAGTVTGALTVNSGGRVTPSALGGPNANRASPGTLTVNGNVTLNGGANMTWFVNSALTNGNNSVAATAGTLNNYKSQYTASLLSTSGNIDLNGASSANRIVIEIVSLALSNASGPLYDLNGNSDARSWVIAEATGTGQILGFAPDKFNFNTAGFSASAGAGTFQINQVGQSLVMTFTPVPEPATVLALSSVTLAFGAGPSVPEPTDRSTDRLTGSPHLSDNLENDRHPRVRVSWELSFPSTSVSVGDTGFELQVIATGNSHPIIEAAQLTSDLELSKVIEAWPRLPRSIKVAIFAMIRVPNC